MAENPKEILVYVARHGTTLLNANGCFRGPLDPDLDKKGWADANTLKYYLDPIEIGSIFYSPKKRSRHTAMLINRGRLDTPYYGNEGLQALNVGDLGGQKKTPETEAIVKYHTEHPDEPFEGGESFNDFRNRVRPLLLDAVNLAVQFGRPTLIVAHSSIVHETGQLFNDDHSSTLVQPGGLAAVFASDGELHAEAIFKPDLERIGHTRAEVIT